eukprot:TRINITY_DN11694_c0_g1_i2.p3 TRINITY_DN11694_c0_g1~~TRINITY_DN11694_c0_g1_i2.p3  ORF type:complete len:133 (-),score=0.73 TRINITY_DN11694_c0_g1_i2:83-481(-)
MVTTRRGMLQDGDVGELNDSVNDGQATDGSIHMPMTLSWCWKMSSDVNLASSRSFRVRMSQEGEMPTNNSIKNILFILYAMVSPSTSTSPMVYWLAYVALTDEIGVRFPVGEAGKSSAFFFCIASCTLGGGS